MNIIGINCFKHDSSAALVRDGIIMSAIEEERLNRKKHYGGFPSLALKTCLDSAQIKIDDVDYFGFYMQPWVKLFKMGLFHSLLYVPKTKRFFNGQITSSIRMLLHYRHIMRFSKRVPFMPKILYIQHHVAHAASAFFPSPFKEAAILSVDGAGEYSTLLLAYGRENRIYKITEVNFPHSLGFVYSALTRYLGFEPNEDEYKVMGLASYGKPTFYEGLKRLVYADKNGRFKVNLNYFNYYFDLDAMSVSAEFIKLFGPPRKKTEPIEGRYADMAASIQRVLEDIILEILDKLYYKTKIKNLCLAGGVALNCSMNGRIIREGPFENVFVQPAANDSGTSLGCALYIQHCILGNRQRIVMKNAYFGPEYSNEQIRIVLSENKLRHMFCNDIAQVVADLLAKGNVVGWFQGKMEFGPRALGNRSILADPRKPEMKDIVNKRIKHREPFRPFAPSVLEECAPAFFDGCNYSPYMTFVYPVKSNKHTIIPAVTHVDGTARVQTVNKNENPKYWKLIKYFEKITGVPVLLNTSFNVKGEPIVCSPEDAIRCFFTTGLDYLAIGDYLVSK